MPIRLRNCVEQVVCVLEVSIGVQGKERNEFAEGDGVMGEAPEDDLGMEGFELLR